MDPEIIALIEELKQLIGSMSVSVWQAAIQKTYADIIINLVSGGVLAQAAIVCYKNAVKAFKEEKAKDERYPSYELCMIFWIMVAVFSIPAFILLSTGINQLLSPAWTTIERLSGLIK